MYVNFFTISIKVYSTPIHILQAVDVYYRSTSTKLIMSRLKAFVMKEIGEPNGQLCMLEPSVANLCLIPFMNSKH